MLACPLLCRGKKYFFSSTLQVCSNMIEKREVSDPERKAKIILSVIHLLQVEEGEKYFIISS